MYKNQLQELAQRSCFNLPSYACIREGPDHAPRFKASVNFNGEVFQSPDYCPTLRQAEHAAAEVALNLLSAKGPSKSLTARVLDETGIYKNLLQETAHRAGLKLPVYATERSGPGHQPVFTTTVELAGMSFTGEHAKTKKQAEKNAASAAWSALKTMANSESEKDANNRDDHELVIKVLSNLSSTDECKQSKKRDQNQSRRRSVSSYGGGGGCLTAQKQKSCSFMSLLPPPPPRTTSKILPPIPTTPLLNRPITTTDHSIKAKSPVRLPDTKVAIQEHKKDDDDDWFLLYTDFIKKIAIEKEINAKSTTPITGSSSTTRIGTPLYTGGYNGVHKIAPAVHVRSVIPVCAAPVQIRTPQPPSTGGANEVQPPMLNKSKTQVETPQQQQN